MTTRSIQAVRVAAAMLLGCAASVLVVACGDSASDGDVDDPFTGCGIDKRECDVLCDEGLGCVECVQDADCGAAAPACAHGRCRECGTNAQCGAGEACFLKDGKCEPACADDGDCPDDQDICDEAGGGRCLQCLTDQDCGEGEPRCDPVRAQCVECATDVDCGAADPVCDEADGKCKECNVDADCREGSVCRGDHKCHDSCESDLDCEGDNDPICRVEDGDCVECTSDIHCGAATPHCNEKEKCVECLTAEHCLDEARPFCDDDRDCVECRNEDDCPDGLKCKDHRCED